jgi:hypothetical protein
MNMTRLSGKLKLFLLIPLEIHLPPSRIIWVEKLSLLMIMIIVIISPITSYLNIS